MNATEARALSMDFIEILYADNATQIYGAYPPQYNRIHRKLMQKWRDHAGYTPEAARVRLKLQQFFSSLKANELLPLAAGLTFSLPEYGKFTYYDVQTTEGVGDFYVGTDRFAWRAHHTVKDLVDLAEANLTKLQSSLQTVPGGPDYFVGMSQLKWTRVEQENHHYLVMEPPPGFLSLEEIRRKKGPLDTRHVAWILTRLYNAACLMAHAEVVNMDLRTSRIYIHPGAHDLIIVDGWQYAQGSSLKALPANTAKTYPELSTGDAKMSAVSAMIQKVAKNLLTPTGYTLEESLAGAQYQPLETWLTRDHFEEDPVKELTLWNKEKVKAFGPAKFIPWNLTKEDLNRPSTPTETPH